MPDVSAASEKKPTQQQYEDAKKELIDLLNKKKQIDRTLVSLEASIYAFEGSYLEDTATTGNIIRGFDSYLKAQPTSYGSSRHKKVQVSESDRLFSLSSSTYTKSLQLKQGLDVDSGDDIHLSSSSTKKDKKRKKRNDSRAVSEDESGMEGSNKKKIKRRDDSD